MRYQPIETTHKSRDTSVAAVWPSFEEALLNRQPLPLEGQALEPTSDMPDSPASAAPDVPAAVGGLIAGSYAALIGVFFAFFAASPLALFVVTISALFVAIYFALPRIFFAVEADPARRPTLAQFWYEGMQTLTGRSSGRDAMIQMLIVPVFLTFGLLAMGIVARIYIG